MEHVLDLFSWPRSLERLKAIISSQEVAKPWHFPQAVMVKGKSKGKEDVLEDPFADAWTQRCVHCSSILVVLQGLAGCQLLDALLCPDG